jgi:Ribonuclease G/E
MNRDESNIIPPLLYIGRYTKAHNSYETCCVEIGNDMHIFISYQDITPNMN